MIKSFNQIFLIGSALIILFACQKDVSVSEPQEFEMGISKFYISTEPAGAAIFVDNRNTGLFTPDTIKWLAEGNHNFTLKLDPFLDYAFEDNSFDDNVNSREYSFYSDPKNFGSLKFNSDPDGCVVYLNDSLMSFKTPHILFNLLPARYKVKYEYPEHRADSTNIFVYAGKQSFVNMDLADTTVWVTYNTENSDFTDNTINDILIEEDNTMWVGTRHNGIIKIKDGKKIFLTKENSNLTNNIINRIEQDANGTVWIATYAGLAKIDGDIINTFTTTNSGLQSNYISDIAFDKSGNTWVGTQQGLSKYDGSSWETFTSFNSSIPANFITCVTIGENDTVWIGTNQFSTSKYHGDGNWTTYQADSLLLGDSVADIFYANDNYLWVGLVTQPTKGKFGGVFKLSNGVLVEEIFGIANKRINRFYQDDDDLWIGTRSGAINVKPSGNFDLYTSIITGLPINDIISIARDKNDNIWFGTNGSGLVKYKIWNDQ